MSVGERELYERFVDYEEEQLLRILTVERAAYRPEALAAAELVLWQRGVAPPSASVPMSTVYLSQPVTAGATRPKTRYQLIDLFVDASLLGFLYWVTERMEIGSVLPESWLADSAVRLLFISLLTIGVMYLRHAWRTKTW